MNWNRMRVEQKMGCKVYGELESQVQRGEFRELWVDARKGQDGHDVG